MSIINQKSELLFLYETKYSMPNGDPFTGEQRYDEETKRVLVSDVRMKRFIRDYLLELGREIFVVNDKSQIEQDAESGAASRLNALLLKYKEDAEIKSADAAATSAENSPQASLPLGDAAPEIAGKEEKGKGKKGGKKGASGIDVIKLLQKCIDVRLFGGISTKEGMAVNLTGPVQFGLLNPSLNRADLRIHQNTSVFSSSAEKTRGAIGTTSVVPYALCQIHGWVNPFSARHTGLSEDDLNEMFAALWHSVNNANTRTKSNQSSLLLLQIVYREVTDKLYGVDKMIQIKSEQKNDEQLRGMEDFELDFTKLKEAAENEKVAAINFYTEYPGIEKSLQGIPKMQKIILTKLAAEQ